MSWLTKHTRNLLKDRPIDNIGSALHAHGKVDPATGKKTHPGPGDQLDSKLFTKKTNPKGSDTSIPEDEAARLKIKDAIRAAKNKAKRLAKTPAGRAKARDNANKAERSKIKLNKK